MAFVKAAGFDFTAEEIKSVSEELSDTELESISGGAKYCILPTDDGSYIAIVG
jgi:bacteriocin-like protein